ncbi:MAG: hypothetical protein VKP62_10010 [Candidatus Sericytochromatia bacterium]|nr:hypothetical protein [Candidatus Sericytochromatia bacterium]
MFGRISALAVAAAVLSASPALAFTQDAPTSYLGQNTAAVLSKGVSYVSASGPGNSINYATAMGGGELGLGLGGAFALAGGLGTGINLAGAYKYPLSRMGSMAASVAVNTALNGIGAAMAVGGLGVAVPLTWDMGSAMVSVSPNFRAPALLNPMNNATVGADVGVQYPVSPAWSVLGTIMPSYAMTGGAIAAPIMLGARLSPSSTAHVDFNLANVTVAPATGLTVGTIAVTGHVGWR